ncbi:hypothetical protein [Corynebacterium sp. AOP12-C2-36]|uniref:hypothetical protein n=1 Tax=Corynebacterium sp. AOP12-C2-36 TaxID=3457723 RepID=UPI004034E275
MSNIARATLVINETYADEYVKMHMTPPKVAAALDDAGCLAPDLQIIRTPAELEALDPDTLVEKPGTVTRTARQAINVAGHWGVGAVLPAVVVATGSHVRACREALEGGAE